MRLNQSGFTLIELLVVIAIIAVLAALLVPVLSYGKFRTRVTVCSNNYKQLALAASLYAGDDSKGRLPAFELPTESSQLVNFHNLYPWTIGLPMLKAMEPYGIDRPQFWYCPVRNKLQSAAESFRLEFGKPMATINDFTKYFTDFQRTKYGFVDLNWWVPRPLEGAPNVTYPNASLLPARLTTPWPSKMEDPTVSTRPIVSDWMLGSKENLNGPSYNDMGAHFFGGRVRSVNSGYADGHVETHAAGSIQWELQLRDGSYIFY